MMIITNIVIVLYIFLTFFPEQLNVSPKYHTSSVCCKYVSRLFSRLAI